MSGLAMLRITPLIFVSLVCAASGGWWLGRKTFQVGLESVSDISGKPGVPFKLQTFPGANKLFEGMAPGLPLADWMARAEVAVATGFPELLAELTQIFPNDAGPDGKTMAAARWLLGLWVLKDADAAIQFGRDQVDPDLKAALGEALAWVHPGRGLELLTSRRKDGPDWAMEQTIANRLAVIDPEAFLQLDPSCWGDGASVADALAALARQDPSKATARWESLRGTPDFPEKQSLYLMMDALVSGDSRAAGKWVGTITDPSQRRMASHAWLAALARSDPRAAVREMKGLDLGSFDGSASVEAIRVGLPGDFGDGRAAVLLSLARLNRAEGLAAVEELLEFNPELSSRRSFLLSHLVEVSTGQMMRYSDDPATFMQSLRGSIANETDVESRDALQLAYLREQLRGRSAGFALELAKLRASELSERSGSTAGELDRALVEMLDHVAESDPGAMLGVMERMPVRERQMAADQISDHVGLRDVEILGRTLPWQSAERWERLVDTYVGYLSSSPEVLKEMAPSFAALSGEVAVPAITFYSQMWAQEDPISALNWAATLPPETLPAAVGGAVQSWMKSDDAAASGWTNTLPAGPVRDAAAAGLVKALYQYDVSGAMAWAGSISNPAVALDVLNKMARDFSYGGDKDFTNLLPATLDRLGASPEQRQAVNAALIPPPEPLDPFREQ